MRTTVGDAAWSDTLLAAIPQGVVVLDGEGRVVEMTPSAERISGRSHEEALGRHCDEVFVARPHPSSFLARVAGKKQGIKIAVALPDDRNQILHVTQTAVTLPDGAEGWVLVFCDVSESEIAHRLLGSFIANVAHELRTPLSALGASVQLLLDQLPDLSAAELSELLSSLHLGVWRLQTLVDNLLEVASMELGHFRVSAHPASVREIVAEAAFTVKPLLDRHGQRLVLNVPERLPLVQVDFRRTVQVLINLLGNASKYGPERGAITVTVSAAEDGRVRISVVDEGPGIPKALHAQLFQQFMRLDQGAARGGTGAGLGLSVVKAIVEAQGGEVGVMDRLEGGTEVVFTVLPVSSQTVRRRRR